MAWKNLNPKEDSEQVTLCQVLDRSGILYHSNPNGLIVSGLPDKTRSRILSKMKKMGMKSGVSDLLILTRIPNKPTARGLYLEMKRKKGGKVSKEQREWIQKVKLIGFEAIVCYGWQDGVKKLSELGYRVSLN